MCFKVGSILRDSSDPSDHTESSHMYYNERWFLQLLSAHRPS